MKIRLLQIFTFGFALLANTAFTAENRDAVLLEELPKLQTIYVVPEIAKPKPETRLTREYYRRLNRYVRYLHPNMHDWPSEPGARFHKRDASHEHDVRQNATVILTLATLSAFGDFDERLAGVSREKIRADAAGLIRYLAITHNANFLPTGDGKSWGDAWQSAFWTAIAGQGAWLMWEHLPDDTRVMVARMIVHEADRYNERPPDDGKLRDSKAEENAWNSEVLALAACMFPSHPNAALWRERCIVYMINAFSTAADHHDERLVDGKPLKEWVSTVCIHDDFTLENHNRVHPDYLSGFTLNLRNAIVFAMAGQPAPEAAFHHAADCLKVLTHLSAANGGLFYVNGQDWWPHRHDVALMAGGLAGVFLRDPQAAFIEQGTMDWLAKMHSRFDDGRAWDAREFNYPNAEEELMARYCETYLAHRLVGNAPKPVSRRAFEKAQAGVRIFEAGGFVTHRTPEKFVSFAWLNGGTGLVYPEGDTWFTSPYERSLVGQISIAGTKDTTPQLEQKKVVALNLNNDDAPDGFAFVGRFARSEGKVGQSVAMISLPGQPVIYAERLQARTDVRVNQIATGTFAMLNEDAKPITQNERTIWTAEGSKLIRGASAEPTQLHHWNSDWVNLDDRLTIVANSGRMAFEENHAYARSRLQQLLIANHRKDVGTRRTGEIISNFAMALVPNAGHRKKIEFRTERLGKDGVVVELSDWVAAINFSDRPATGRAFGKRFDVGPLDVSITKRR